MHPPRTLATWYGLWHGMVPLVSLSLNAVLSLFLLIYVLSQERCDMRIPGGLQPVVSLSAPASVAAVAHLQMGDAPAASVPLASEDTHCICSCLCPAVMCPACPPPPAAPIDGVVDSLRGGRTVACPACHACQSSADAAGGGGGINATAPRPPPFPAVARYSDPSAFCSRNPFLDGWRASDYLRAARDLVRYRSSMVDAVQGRGWLAQKHDRFNAVPAVQACPSRLLRYGGKGDGGKILCGIDKLRSGCVVYSLGSAYDFAFEASIVKLTPCDVYTFDCTVSESDPRFPRRLDPRIHFYSLCLGRDGSDPAYASLRTLAGRLGHGTIDLLKFDTEGFEYTIIESLLADYLADPEGGEAWLPLQMSFEAHYMAVALGKTVLPWTMGQFDPRMAGGDVSRYGLSPGDMSVLWSALTDLGYSIVSREDNPRCDMCAEFTVVRSFCGDAGGGGGGG